MRAVALLLTLSIACTACGRSDNHELVVRTFYFPKPELCTVMVDFEPSREAVAATKDEARTLLLARTMLRDYATNGKSKCQGAARVRLLAMFITGVDNYGRPDFGARQNLIRMDADAEGIAGLALAPDGLTLKALRTVGDLEIF
jgi:hypothetical protein